VYPAEDSPQEEISRLTASVGTDLKTPPSYDDLEELDREPAPAADAPSPPVPERSIDSFMASLEALRATIRAGTEIESPPKMDTPSGMAERREDDLSPARTAIDDGGLSALERMPLPPPVDGPTPTPRPAYQPGPPPDRRRSKGTAKSTGPAEVPTLDSALRAVRDAVPGLTMPAALKPDTPIQGRTRPASDGIPKSVSEDLPKYPARPRIRTCNRCGHETKLRDAKCQRCSHVDESLGILDSVIAGDLARVEQVLLVRPHLITMRTSRHDWTLLHMAASGGNPKMVELLIDKGVSVNAVNRDGKTALHYAAAKGHAGIVQTLLDNLADPAMLYNGKSALDLARKNGRKEVEDVLRRKLNTD
jgi:hypothetical protein